MIIAGVKYGLGVPFIWSWLDLSPANLPLLTIVSGN